MFKACSFTFYIKLAGKKLNSQGNTTSKSYF